MIEYLEEKLQNAKFEETVHVVFSEFAYKHFDTAVSIIQATCKIVDQTSFNLIALLQ